MKMMDMEEGRKEEQEQEKEREKKPGKHFQKNKR